MCTFVCSSTATTTTTTTNTALTTAKTTFWWLRLTCWLAYKLTLTQQSNIALFTLHFTNFGLHLSSSMYLSQNYIHTLLFQTKLAVLVLFYFTMLIQFVLNLPTQLYFCIYQFLKSILVFAF